MEGQDWFEHSPDLLVAPVLAHDVSQIVLPTQESKADKLGSNSFLQRQGVMSFVKLGMRLGGAVNNSLFVTKHIALLSYRYTEIMENQL